MTKKYLGNKKLDLETLYNEVLEFMLEAVMKHGDAQIIASTMLALSLRLYKTSLTDSEFKDMIKIVVKSSKEVKPFEINRLH